MTAAGCQGFGHHTMACYGPETHPCPGCGTPVTQSCLQCGTQDPLPPLRCVRCVLACDTCPAEVRLNDTRTLARVVHSAECPWWRRYQAGEVRGTVPCGVRVTHRGPYKVSLRKGAP
jgi:hypothetical protein